MSDATQLIYKQICEIADTNPESLTAGIPSSLYFRYVDLSAVERGVIQWNNVTGISIRTAPSRARRIIKSGDVLFGTVRPNLQSHGFIGDQQESLLVASTGFSVIRAIDGLSHPNYLFHCVMSNQIKAQAERYAMGSNYPAVNDSDVRRFTVFAPALPEQKQIAQILDTLDTAIRETEAIIAKLQAVKQGLLHDLLTRGLDASGQLRPPPALAPELYQDSPLGLIPREWEVGNFGKWLLKIEAGKSFDCPDITAPEGEWGVLKVSAVHPSGFRSSENKIVLNKSLANPDYEVQSGDLLITRSNTPQLVGLVCLVEQAPRNLLLCDKTLRLIVNTKEADKSYCFFALQQPFARAQIEISATGSSGSMKNIGQDAIRAIQLPMPLLNEQQEISCFLKKHEVALQAEQQRLDKYRELKSGLMDDLLTGRVRVKVLDTEMA